MPHLVDEFPNAQRCIIPGVDSFKKAGFDLGIGNIRGIASDTNRKKHGNIPL